MADVLTDTSAPSKTAAERPRRRVPSWLITVVSVALVLLVWEWFGRDVNPVFGSYPSAIALAFVELARSGQLGTALLESLQPFLAGYVLAIILGVPLG
ncbi:MAG: ABC transporter permease, partial [Xanthobacteraceae bacterium]